MIRLGKSEYAKIVAAVAAVIALAFTAFAFFGASPSAVRKDEARLTRIEVKQEATLEAIVKLRTEVTAMNQAWTGAVQRNAESINLLRERIAVLEATQRVPSR